MVLYVSKKESTLLFYLSAILLIGIGLAHSYLGERYILIRLFRRDNLPKLFGSDELTKNTLRFAWHLTTLAWFGFAAILIYMAQGELRFSVLGNIVGITFILHSLVSLVIAKGKHLSWLVFLMVGLVTLYASNV